MFIQGVNIYSNMSLKHSIQNLCTFNNSTKKCNGFFYKVSFTIHANETFFKQHWFYFYGNGTTTETYVTGKYPVLPFSVPSYQLSSILVFRLIVSPSLKLSSPGLSASKSYSAWQEGMTGGPRVGVVAGDGLGDGVGFDPQAESPPKAGLQRKE